MEMGKDVTVYLLCSLSIEVRPKRFNSVMKPLPKARDQPIAKPRNKKKLRTRLGANNLIINRFIQYYANRCHDAEQWLDWAVDISLTHRVPKRMSELKHAEKQLRIAHF